jgi:hypothetical protein
MIQLNPPIPLETPMGRGAAHMAIDYGPEYSLVFVTFINETGECWCFRNSEVRLCANLTFGREKTTEIRPLAASV